MSRTQTDSDVLRNALRYAERGIRVFPVQSDAKAPCHRLIDSWTEEATTDEEQIRRWFSGEFSPNVGIATGQWDGDGELFVVDIDVPGGFETWDQLRQERDTPVPETTAVATPSGGAHLYFIAPAGVTIKSASENLGDSVDTKGHGGYVVAPPSTAGDGQYNFRDDTEGFAQAPFWIVSAAAKETEQTNQERMGAPSTDYEGDPDEAVVEDALSSIPPQPGYKKWMRIIAAVKDAVDTERHAAQLLEQWSPENRNGDYNYGERLRNAADEEITAGTLFWYAKRHGWTPPWEMEAPQGDGQAGAPPDKPHPAERGEEAASAPHPDEWYEPTPNGYPDDEEGEGENVTLEDLDIESLPELLTSDIRPPEPLITYEGRSLLHEGTSQLAAKPKIGKTNLAMNMGLAIASDGGVALGNATVQRHGRVLMLNLDGSRRGSYDRFSTMTESVEAAPDRFDLLHGGFPEVGDGALDLLREYVEENPDTELVIVDTLQHLRPTSDGRRNVYHEDYDFVHPISEFGRETDTSVLLVHHLNKLNNGDELDKVSGSTGLTGAVENVMILDRARGESHATLSIRPREDQEEDFDLKFDGQIQTWIVGREHYEPKSSMRQNIYDFLCEVEQSTLGNIAEAVGKSTDSVSKRLTEMKQNGAPIKKPQRGVYKIVSGAS
jgi:hypothetical protein